MLDDMRREIIKEAAALFNEVQCEGSADDHRELAARFRALADRVEALADVLEAAELAAVEAGAVRLRDIFAGRGRR